LWVGLWCALQLNDHGELVDLRAALGWPVEQQKALQPLRHTFSHVHLDIQPLLVRVAPTPVFFSSRRRHTSFSRDWSSDVCSSDLEGSDFYTVPLSEQNLRPGTVYADPYGHLLIIAKRVPQTDGNAGVFLAVDAQPDGTVARKRFWRGNFLFAQDPALGDPGFKRFRPIVRDKNGALRRLTVAEISKNPNYSDFSLEQTKLSIEAFYDKMDDVMSPDPLDPLRAMKEAITSLEEQVKA